ILPLANQMLDMKIPRSTFESPSRKPMASVPEIATEHPVALVVLDAKPSRENAEVKSVSRIPRLPPSSASVVADRSRSRSPPKQK
ncbi:hypothetical protein ScPMuIL_001974, partial [Solemya velum]